MFDPQVGCEPGMTQLTAYDASATEQDPLELSPDPAADSAVHQRVGHVTQEESVAEGEVAGQVEDVQPEGQPSDDEDSSADGEHSPCFLPRVGTLRTRGDSSRHAGVKGPGGGACFCPPRRDPRYSGLNI